MRSVVHAFAGTGRASAQVILGGFLVCASAGAIAAPPLPGGAVTDSSVPEQYRLSTLYPALGHEPMLPGVASLGAGQEIQFSLPATFGFDLLSRGYLDEMGSPLDRPRATYRYTWYSHPGWDLKVGLSTTVDNSSTWQRYFSAATDHLRAGGMPSMHISSEGHLSDRWLWSVSAEGLLTGRGQGLDMDLRVDYSLTRNVALFGSYRLTDSNGEVPEFYGFVPSNSARFGVRLRF